MQNSEEDWTISAQRLNMDLWLEMVNANLRAARNAAQIRTFECLKQLSKSTTGKGARGRRRRGRRERELLSVAGSYPLTQPSGLGSTHLSLKRKHGALSLWQTHPFLLPRYYAWQLLVEEFLHALVFRGIVEKPPKRLHISAVVRKQTPHGRCHIWFSEEDRERGKV